MAVVKLDTPVLLITDHVWDGTVNMAHLYQYHKNESPLYWIHWRWGYWYKT